MAANDISTKTCSRCKSELPTTAFYKRRDRPSGLHSQCGQCFREQHAEWRKHNKQNNRDRAARFRARHPELVRLRSREHQKANLAAARANNAFRHASKLRATPRWVNRDDLKAVYVKAKEMGLTVDHIVPLQSAIVCGLHVPWNLQLLSASENCKKKNLFWPDMP